MTLPEAVAVFWPEGPLTVTSLRTAIRDGDLAARKLVGRVFTTPKALKEMAVVRKTESPVRVRFETAAEREQRGRAAQASALERNAQRRERLKSGPKAR